MLTLRNRQRTKAVNMRLLRRVIAAVLKELGHEPFDLGIYLVTRSEITRLNEKFLRHKGPTDVISFNYGESIGGDFLSGEIFVCVEEAISQARRFRTTWQGELVRYAIHGVLHLHGYDDRSATTRQRMKREEDRALGEIAKRFSFQQIAGKK